MSRVVVAPHFGMGDMLLLYSLFKQLCERHDRVAVLVRRSYLRTCATLYADLAPTLQLVPLSFAVTENARALRAAMLAMQRRGYDACLLLGDLHWLNRHRWRSLDPNWVRALYKGAGADPDRIHADFPRVPPTPRAAALAARVRAIAGGKKAVLVHDDAGRRLRLPPPAPDEVRVHVDDPRIRSDDMFDYVDALREAERLHCIESCFAHLVDLARLPTPTTVHMYSKPDFCPLMFDPAVDVVYGRPGQFETWTVPPRAVPGGDEDDEGAAWFLARVRAVAGASPPSSSTTSTTTSRALLVVNDVTTTRFDGIVRALCATSCAVLIAEPSPTDDDLAVVRFLQHYFPDRLALARCDRDLVTTR